MNVILCIVEQNGINRIYKQMVFLENADDIIKRMMNNHGFITDKIQRIDKKDIEVLAYYIRDKIDNLSKNERQNNYVKCDAENLRTSLSDMHYILDIIEPQLTNGAYLIYYASKNGLPIY